MVFFICTPLFFLLSLHCLLGFLSRSAYNAGDSDLIPQSGRSPGEGNGNPLQYSCMGNPTDRGTWQATVHGVAKSPTLCCPRSSALRMLLRLSPDSHLHTQGCTFLQGSRPPESLPRVPSGPSHSTKTQLILCCPPSQVLGLSKGSTTYQLPSHTPGHQFSWVPLRPSKFVQSPSQVLPS